MKNVNLHFKELEKDKQAKPPKLAEESKYNSQHSRAGNPSFLGGRTGGS
jgi:hypothetical protein